MNIEKHQALTFPQVPDVVPLIYRSLPLSNTVAAPFVAIPFSEAYRRSGKRAIAHSRSVLETKFRLASDTGMILSGVENDRHVEQWWGSTERKAALKILREQGVAFATTPNFSMVADVPRHDNMHNMKRIGLIWSELHEAGIPTAFHVNGRTDRDFQRFCEFLKFHNEIEAIAFEYTTGAGNHERGEYFTGLLLQLAGELARPLTIVLRGGARWTGLLSHSFARVVVLDATACVRTIKRQRAVRMPGGTLRWRSNPTEKGAPIDELLSYNFSAVTESVMEHRKTTKVHTATSSEPKATRQSKQELEADHETLQGSFL